MHKHPTSDGQAPLAAASSPSSGDAQNVAEAPNLSLTLGGRRYQLVPVDEPSSAPIPSTAAQCLTERELQVVLLVAAGWGNKEIASKLAISVWTVSTHLRRIFAKLGVKTRAAMVSRCFEALPPRE